MREYTKSEQEKAEILEAADKENRNSGFRMMHFRDAGGAKITDQLGGDVIMEWHVPKDRRPEGRPYTNIPDGCFRIIINGQAALIDAEEFRKQLRWV